MDSRIFLLTISRLRRNYYRIAVNFHFWSQFFSFKHRLVDEYNLISWIDMLPMRKWSYITISVESMTCLYLNSGFNDVNKVTKTCSSLQYQSFFCFKKASFFNGKFSMLKNARLSIERKKSACKRINVRWIFWNMPLLFQGFQLHCLWNSSYYCGCRCIINIRLKQTYFDCFNKPINYISRRSLRTVRFESEPSV